MRQLSIFSACTALLLAVACTRETGFTNREDSPVYDDYTAIQVHLDLPDKPFHYEIELPNYLKANGFGNFAVNDEKATLGRVLFYDKNLSRDRTVACASCHIQSRGFSDTVALSLGIEGRRTLRNALALNDQIGFAGVENSGGWSSSSGTFVSKKPLLFWDHRATNVAEQSEATFANEREMGMPMTDVVEQVKKMPYYPYLWKRAFGHFEPTSEEVLDAITNFVNSLATFDSRFDKGMVAQGAAASPDSVFSNFTEAENRGRALYMDFCGGCHSKFVAKPPVEMANTGLDLDYLDEGLGALTNNPKDMGVFKVPPLRNIALTAPYMHDGRFQTLEQMVVFYSDSVQWHPNVSGGMYPPWCFPNGPGFRFNEQQKTDLVAFLKTLTDERLGRDVRFGNPFK